MLPKLSLSTGSICAASLCFAVLPANAACLRGRATDAAGAAVPHVSIVARQAGDSSSHEALSDASGAFEMCELDPGRYQITAEHEGFAPAVRDETVMAEAELSLDLRLARTDATPAAPPADLHGGYPAGEFQYAGEADLPEGLPDSPAVAGARRNLAHGQAYGLWGSGLVAQPGVDLVSQFPLSQLGASLGGDLGSSRTAYFVSFDQYGFDPQRLLSAVEAAQARAARPLAIHADVLTSSSFEARIDHRFNARDSAFLRMNAGNVHTGLAARAADGSPTLTEERHLTQVSAAAGNTVSLSRNTIDQSSARFTVNEAMLPAGATEVGIQSSEPTLRRDRVLEAANSVYRQMGGQSLRLGGDFLFNQMSVSSLESALGDMDGFSFSQSRRSGGLYILSQRQVGRALLLTSGLRYEMAPVKGFHTDTNNLAPQAGFAWSPTSRTVLRGGGAIYYDQVPLPAIAASDDPTAPADLQNSGSYSARGGNAAGPSAFFTLMSPRIQNSYVETANLGIEQRLSAHTVLASDYQFGRGMQLAIPIQRSALICGTSAGCHEGKMFYGGEQGTGARSSYNGFSVSITQEPGRWGNYRIAYTRAEAVSFGMEGNSSTISDNLRRVSFTGVLHTSAAPAANWQQRWTHGYVFSGSGDYASHSEFMGMNFIDMNASLTKTLVWGESYRLEAQAESFTSLERINAAFSRSLANAGDSMASMFSVYRAVASLQGPTGAKFGLRLGF